jgi:hypothetical protein
MNIFTRFAIYSFLVTPIFAYWCSPTCFKMSEAKVLTFYQGSSATNSKGQNFPHIYCAEGNACSDVGKIKSVQCFNQGTDYTGKVNWRCETNLVGDDISVDYANPTCEGYSSQNDNEFGYTGSCICMVKVNYKSPASTSFNQPSQSYTNTTNNSNNSNMHSWFIGIMLVMILMYAMKDALKRTYVSLFPYTFGRVSLGVPIQSSYASAQQYNSSINSLNSGLRQRNVTQNSTQSGAQQTIAVSHGTSTNANYPTVSSAPVQVAPVNQVQQTIISHGSSTNANYPNVTTSVSTTVSNNPSQQNVVSHGTSTNANYPQVSSTQQQTGTSTQKQTQQNVVSHGTSNNGAYPVI